MKELLFFDFECRQENGNHKPNLCIVENEAGNERIFQGDNTRDEFCKWLFMSEHANYGSQFSGLRQLFRPPVFYRSTVSNTM